MGQLEPAAVAQHSVFTAMARDRVEAVLVQRSQMIFARRARIAALAAKSHLPTIGWSRDTVEAGWLMSYGPNIISLFRRAAYYVDKVLRGTKPADLPSIRAEVRRRLGVFAAGERFVMEADMLLASGRR